MTDTALLVALVGCWHLLRVRRAFTARLQALRATSDATRDEMYRDKWPRELTAREKYMAYAMRNALPKYRWEVVPEHSIRFNYEDMQNDRRA